MKAKNGGDIVPVSDAQKKANSRYLSKFVEIKIRILPAQKAHIQAHATTRGESTAGFVLRAIDEAIQRDMERDTQP